MVITVCCNVEIWLLLLLLLLAATECPDKNVSLSLFVTVVLVTNKVFVIMGSMFSEQVCKYVYLGCAVCTLYLVMM